MTENFSIREVMRSSVATALKIDNAPPTSLIPTITRTAQGMERVRKTLGYPVKVHSWYRCDALNRAVGGAKDSQHIKGEAVDFTCPAFGVPREIILRLTQHMDELGIDQIILEPSWVHISFSAIPRREILTRIGQKYLQGILTSTV